MNLNLKNETGAETVTVKKRRFSFKGKKWVVISLIAVAVVVAVISTSMAKPKPKIVTTAVVAKKDLVQSIALTGNVEARNMEKTILNTTQKVVDVFIKEGDDVKKGTVLAKLDTTDYEYQLKRAVINLNTAQTNMANSSKTTGNSIRQAEINLEKAKGDYEQLKKKFDANQVLFENGYISKFDFDASQKSLIDAENQIKSMEISLENAKNNNSDAAQKSQRDLSKTEIDNLNKKIADSTITAGMDGRVVKFGLVKNEYPKQDNNTVIVCDPLSYKVVVGVSQYDAVKIKVGQKVSIKVKGVDNQYAGTVSKIGELAEVTVSGTNKESRVNIEISIDNADDLIKIGYEVDADITIKDVKDTVSVSFESVKQEADGRKYVFAIQDGKVIKKYIKTGLETDFDVEVLEGLSQGDQYISNPSNTLREGELAAVPEVKKK